MRCRPQSRRQRNEDILVGLDVGAVDVAFDAPHPAAGLVVEADLATEDRAVGIVVRGCDRERREGAGECQVAVVAVAPAPAAVEPEIDPGPGRSHHRRSHVGRCGPYPHIRSKRPMGKHRRPSPRQITVRSASYSSPPIPCRTRGLLLRRADQKASANLHGGSDNPDACCAERNNSGEIHYKALTIPVDSWQSPLAARAFVRPHWLDKSSTTMSLIALAGRQHRGVRPYKRCRLARPSICIQHAFSTHRRSICECIVRFAAYSFSPCALHATALFDSLELRRCLD